jgi:hypothetical protein
VAVVDAESVLSPGYAAAGGYMAVAFLRKKLAEYQDKEMSVQLESVR